MSIAERITTKDILAVLLVGGLLVYQGIAQWFGKPLDAGLMGMVGLVVGYYFPNSGKSIAAEPLPAPATGEPVDAPVA